MTEKENEHLANESEFPRKTTCRKKMGMGSIVLLVCLIILLIVVCLPQFLKVRKDVDNIATLNNAKQIYRCLQDFEQDFGSFPDDFTAAAKPSLMAFKGTHANAYLGQLIAGGYTTSEEIFRAHDRTQSRQLPDNIITPPSNILERGENGFAYVLVQENGGKRGLTSSETTALPLLLAPLVDAYGTFEPTSYQNRGVYVLTNGAAKIEPLRSSDHKIVVPHSNKTLFDHGADTAWGNRVPRVLLPYD